MFSVTGRSIRTLWHLICLSSFDVLSDMLTTVYDRLVFLVSLAATFSPLASNIYFPALDQIAEDVVASHQAVALTITTYL